MRTSRHGGVSQAAACGSRRCGRMLSMTSTSRSGGYVSPLGAEVCEPAESALARGTETLGRAGCSTDAVFEFSGEGGVPTVVARGRAVASWRAPAEEVSTLSPGSTRGPAPVFRMAGGGVAKRAVSRSGHKASPRPVNSIKPINRPIHHQRYVRSMAHPLLWTRAGPGTGMGARNACAFRVEVLVVFPPHIHANTPGLWADGWDGCGLPNRSGREVGRGLIIRAHRQPKVSILTVRPLMAVSVSHCHAVSTSKTKPVRAASVFAPSLARSWALPTWRLHPRHRRSTTS